METDKIVKFLMPTKLKMILFVVLFLILPGFVIHAGGIEIAWLFAGPIIISILIAVNPLTYILFVIEIYIISCLISNHFSPAYNQEKGKPRNYYYTQIRRKTN